MKSILVVDDSRAARSMIVDILKEDGYKVAEAANGKEALIKIQENEPDCLVLDLLMPEMDGIELLELLNKQKVKIPVIILSADIQDTTRNKCFELGVAGFVNKPIKMANELIEAVHNAV